MSLILHGSPSSICTRRILVAVAQAGLLDHLELKIVEDWSVLKTDEWLEHHPVGQLPYLEDTEVGVELFESRAIIKYICLKHKSPLMPTTNDIVKFSKFETACSMEFANFEAFATRITYELIFKKGKGDEPVNEFVLNMAKGGLKHRLQGYERMLEKTRYLAGDDLTVVDLFHLPFGDAMLQTDGATILIDGSLPNVARWWKEISELESWNKVKVEVWGGKLPAWGW